MALFHNIKWLVIRLLLSKEERRFIWFAGVEYFDSIYEDYKKGEGWRMPSKAKEIGNIMRGVIGRQNWPHGTNKD